MNIPHILVHSLKNYINVYIFTLTTYQETLKGAMKAQFSKLALLLIIIIMLNINAIINNNNNPMNENVYIPKHKRWNKCIQMKKWAINKLILLNNNMQTYGKPRTYSVRTHRPVKIQLTNKPYKPKAIAMIALAMQTQATYNASAHNITFDTDSRPIGIDNRCTACISHKVEDFTGPLIDTNRNIKGFGGTRTSNLKLGTLKWRWEDDKGITHKFLIPNSYYAPSGGVRLLSPQHWARTQKDTKPTVGTGETTTHNQCKLFWNQGKHTLHIPMSKHTNVATIHQAPGFNKFAAFCTEIDTDKMDLNPVASPAQIIPMEYDEQPSTKGTRT